MKICKEKRESECAQKTRFSESCNEWEIEPGEECLKGMWPNRGSTEGRDILSNSEE